MAAATICTGFGDQKQNKTKQNKTKNSATVSPSICYEVMGTDAIILVF